MNKKSRNDESGKVTESILDDIRLEDIDTRITVHTIESPESCTHEVAVYPGKNEFNKFTFGILFFIHFL